MKLRCFLFGHNAVALENIPWGARCDRCGEYGYFHGQWINAGPVDLGSETWSQLSRAEKEAFVQFNDTARKPPFHW